MLILFSKNQYGVHLIVKNWLNSVGHQKFENIYIDAHTDLVYSIKISYLTFEHLQNWDIYIVHRLICWESLKHVYSMSTKLVYIKFRRVLYNVTFQSGIVRLIFYLEKKRGLLYTSLIQTDGISQQFFPYSIHIFAFSITVFSGVIR